ncbi:integral membrane protein MviN [Streptomyces sp. NBRC 110611]|nr:integral membrane protein MviN [Streptomyces sp. NBRC 110611]
MVRRLVAYEGRWVGSLGCWVARRRIGVTAGEQAFAYASAQAALVYGVTFVCVVETAGMHALLDRVPVAQAVLLVVDVYTLLMMLGFQAAAVTRPHVLGAGVLRLRDGARRDLRIPLDRIASVYHDLRFAQKGKEGEAGRGGELPSVARGVRCLRRVGGRRQAGVK